MSRCPWHQQKRGTCCAASAGVVVDGDLLERVRQALEAAEVDDLAMEVGQLLQHAGQR